MMARNYLWLVLLAAIFLDSAGFAASHAERGNLIFDNVPDAPMALADKLDAYLSARQATPLGWSPRGQLLIATRFGDVDQLHVVDKAGGERLQITFLHESIVNAAFSPEASRNGYLFLKDAGGGENSQIYYQHLGDSAAKLLTDGKSLNGGAIWSNTGREVAFFTTVRNGVSYDIDIVEPESGALPHVAVTGDGAAWYPLDWSPDDRKLLVLRSVSIGESYLYVVDLSSGQKREVDSAPARVAIAGAKFSRDGQGVYFISDRDGEFAKLRYINLFTNDKTVLSGAIPWDIEELALSRDGHYLAFVSDEGGIGKLNLMDLRTHQDLTPPKLPFAGIIEHLSFDAEGKRIAFGFSAADQPRDAYVLELATNRVEAWTHSEVDGERSQFVVPQVTQFPTFDRTEGGGHARQIPLYLFEPRTAGPHPVLILLHGGPESQFRPTFDAWIQYVVNELGYAVAAPNVRGSTGYGKTYASLDNGMLRDDAVKDLGALIVWLGFQNHLDAKHVVVAGDSYGGYLALAALVNYGDRLIGGVDLGGMTDFISFLTNTAPYRQNQRRAEYGDERDPDMRAFLRRISPLTNADRITRPLLIVHGKNDPRIPSSESEQIVNRLRSRGGEVWYLQAKDEGHGFRKMPNREALYQTYAQFLKSLH